jgi:hypothetical protein
LTLHPVPEEGTVKSLVTFDDTKAAPIHRWYTFKEGFSNHLLAWLEKQGIIDATQRHNLLDPFSGVGTALLSAQLTPSQNRGGLAIGIERNPTIRFITDAKLQWPTYRLHRIMEILEALRRDAGRQGGTFSVPQRSTFTAIRRSGKRAFDAGILQDLIYKMLLANPT